MSLKALVLTSNALRHSYCMMQVAARFELVGAMSEPKKNYFTQARAQSPAVEAHFANLAAAENEFFSAASTASITPRVVDDLNAPEALEAALRLKPDVVCLFGTSILKAPWLEAFPERIVNLHLGLSPYYRGAATLFWPFYDHNLACLGTTIHVAIAKVDAGAILTRIKPRLEVGDDYYRITTRLIRDSLDRFPQVVEAYLQGNIMPQPQEPYPAARVMKKSDFNEAALAHALASIGAGLTQPMIDEIARSTACPC